MEARRIDCPSCGATPSWDGQSETVACDHCGTTIPLPAHLLRELRSHEGEVGAKLDQAAEARSAANLNAEIREGTTKTGRYLAVVFVLFILLPALAELFLFENAGALACVLSTLVLIVWGLLSRKRREALRAQQRPVLRDQAHRCPQCGGPGELLSEDTGARCRWCGHEWIATTEALGRHQEEARDHAEEARLRRLHEARLLEARLSRHPNADLPNFVAAVVLIVPMGLAAIAGVIGGMVVGNYGAEIGGPVITVVLLLFGLLIAVFRRRQRRRADLRASFEGLARELQGRSGEEPSEMAEWLNLHWPKAQPKGPIQLGPLYGWAHGQRRGVPIAIALNLHDDSPSRIPRSLIPVERGAWVFVAEANEGAASESRPRMIRVKEQELERWAEEPRKVEEEALALLRREGLL